MSDDDLMNETGDGDGGSLPWVLPVTTAVVALLVGLALGALAVFGVWKPPTPEPEVVTRDLTEAEMEAACTPFITDTLSVLTEAQAKVVELEDRVTSQEAEVVRLEETMAKRAQAGKRMYAELQAAKAELETLRAQLSQAVEEKEAALAALEETVEQLRATEDELEVTTEKLVLAEADVLDNRWKGFLQNGQLTVCEKGGRKKMGKCREAVLASLGSMEDKYRHCVKSGQAVPGLVEAEKDMEGLPDYSFWLGEDSRITKGWFVTLCDPTLPEADDFADALEALRVDEKGGAGAEAGGPIEDIDR